MNLDVMKLDDFIYRNILSSLSFTAPAQSLLLLSKLISLR